MSSGSGASLAYPIVQRTLANGLRVVASPDHSTPTVAVNLWYDVGSRDEEPGRTGFAHLFEHLMFQGSTHVPSGQHIGLLQAAGASVNGPTTSRPSPPAAWTWRSGWRPTGSAACWTR